MTSSILFCGGEDLSFMPIGGAFTTSANTAGQDITTTSTFFRSSYARQAITPYSQVAQNAVALRAYLGNQSTFWLSARVYSSAGGNAAGGNYVWRIRDSGGVERLRLTNTGTTAGGGPYQVSTVNAAGTATVIGSNLAGGFTSSPTSGVPDKMDVFINYGTSGQLTIYINSSQVYTYSGDITTNSQTSVAYVDFGVITASTSAAGHATYWSEVIAATRDTRNMSLLTQAPSAAGNTDTFTSGAFGNVNGTLVNQASPDYSAAAAQVQQYKVGQAVPSGSFSVVSVVQHGQCTVGPDGPQHIEFNVRTGGSDYFTADMAPGTGWGLVTNNWDTNPNTSAPWATTDLASASTTFNIGYKSTA